MKVITICGSLKFQKEMMIVEENWLLKVIAFLHHFIKYKKIYKRQRNNWEN